VGVGADLLVGVGICELKMLLLLLAMKEAAVFSLWLVVDELYRWASWWLIWSSSVMLRR